MPGIIDPERIHVDVLPGIWTPVQWEMSEEEPSMVCGHTGSNFTHVTLGDKNRAIFQSTSRFQPGTSRGLE